MMRSFILLVSLVVLGAAVPSPGVELQTRAQPGVCQECHLELEGQFGMRHVHEAFEGGDCSGCHNPHASSHEGLLQSRKQDLCLECHDDFSAVAGYQVPHPPAALGGCLDCHHPHASTQAGLLNAPLGELCSSCHSAADQWAERSLVHEPVASGECLSCHAAHGSDLEGMVGTGVPGLCFECHDNDQGFTAAHGGRDISQSNCVACHDPHSSDEKGLLRSRQHAPFASDNCAACHSGLDQGGSFAMAGPVQETCLKCHRGVGSYKNNDHAHNLDSPESCNECHNPHASNEPGLLKADQASLCFGCHFNDKEDKADWMTHPEVDCTECHVAHGNDDYQLLKNRDTMLCGVCHEAAHSVTHPVGPEVIDPRTDEPVTCLSCHQLHGGRFDMYLPLNPDMELCIQCHKR